jgi:hypothetical protein
MDREENSHYVPSRISLWCPVCGASAGQGCTVVKGEFMLRYASHNQYALGPVPRPQIQLEPLLATTPRGPGNKPRWTPQKWQGGMQ